MNEAYIKRKAVGAFVELFDGSVEVLSPSDVFCRVFDKNKKIIAYADVVIVQDVLSKAYPLSVPAKTITKLIDKRLNPVMIWSFFDGIIYCKLKTISGEVSFGKTSDTSPEELIITVFKKQPEILFVV
jgi:hypothetical protein